MDRKRVTLTRSIACSGSLGTFGEIDTGTYKCDTLERPKNAPDHPAIPCGEYDVDWTTVHPRHNPCYEVMNVPGRTAILLHKANWYQELLGCIAPVSKIEVVEGKLPDGTSMKQLGGSGSGAALQGLLADLKYLSFRLIIKEA